MPCQCRTDENLIGLQGRGGCTTTLAIITSHYCGQELTTRQSECRQSRTTLCELLRNKGNRNVRYSDVVSLQRCRQPRQGTAAEAATACRDNRQQCRNHLLHPPSFYTQPTDSVRYLWTSIRQGEPYWGSREWHPITRYADVLHSLAVIPYTAPLPLSD